MFRKIIHIDMDAYYASVETRDNPALKGKPIAVGGSIESRGVISTANYEARKYGVRSAIATKTAFRLCPALILIYPDFVKYSEGTKKLISIYKEYTDIIEPLSLDECYLDVTENKKNIKTAVEVANILRGRIKKELHLTASVGIAPNKLLAKIASEVNKPDGIFVIKPHQIESFIKTLSVNKLWGVGKVTAKKMQGLGIATCADLQKYSIPDLSGMFGAFGETLYEFARGIDERCVVSDHEIKSIGSETTFPVDSNDLSFIKRKLYGEIETVYERLQKKNIKFKTVTLKAKYADFKSITRSKTFTSYKSEKPVIVKTCDMLFKKTEIGRKKIRLIGLSISNFSENSNSVSQLEFSDLE
jgi:DNA polymerase IV